MWERYTVQFPAQLPTERVERAKAICDIAENLRSKIEQVNSDEDPLQLGRIADQETYGIVSMFGSLHMAKKIIESTSLKIMNFVRVQIPEKKRTNSPEHLANYFENIGEKITNAIGTEEFLRLKRSQDTQPPDTLIHTLQVEPNNDVVVLHIVGDFERVKKKIAKLNLKLID